MGRFRDGRGPGSDLAEHEGEDDELAPGRKTLTGQLGKPSIGKPPNVPGRRSLTLALPIRRALETEQGSPLPEPEKWSQRVGSDIAGARIVTGPAASDAAAALQTRAFTVGNRVFFGSGFDATTDGGELLAHELTHVAQQKGAGEPEGYDDLPMLDHGDEREVAAREHKPGLASGLAIARDTTHKKGATKPAAAPQDPATAQRAQQMAQALPMVTKRWKAIGADLFTPIEKPQTVPPLAVFEPAAYSLISADIVDVDPVHMVLAGPGREEYAKAFERAANEVIRDKAHLDELKAAVTNVLAGGQVQFNATRIMAHQSALSSNGKRALAKPDYPITHDLAAYIATDAYKHGEMETPTVDELWIHREGGGNERKRGCEAILKTLQTGAPPDVTTANPGPSQPSKEATAKAVELMKVVDRLATQSKGRKLTVVQVGQLNAALAKAGPDGREAAWSNKPAVGRVIQLLDPASAKLVVEALDPIEALYKQCHDALGGDDPDAKYRVDPGYLDDQTREIVNKKITLKVGGGVYTALHDFLCAHAGDQPMRMRLLQHTKLKNEFIDRLAADNQRVIYRLIIRGSEQPTPEDMVHEAAEKHDGVGVVRGLRALAGSDPGKLAALETDSVFRQMIERMTEEVDVDGNRVRPYQLCMTMWGRKVGENLDPNAASRIETNPGEDQTPLTIPERIKLNSDLFDPCLGELWDEISGAHFARKVKAAADDYDIAAQQQLGYDAMAKKTADPQVVRDTLVKYDHKATTEPYLTLLRRDKVMWAAELEKRFYQKYSQDLRAWIYEKSGPVNRMGAMRVLGLEQGAGVGMFNGKVVMAGEASVDGKMPLAQALRETVVDGTPLTEICSIQSRNIAGAINIGNPGLIQAGWLAIKFPVDRSAESLFKLTGIHVRAIDLMRNAFALHSGHFETRLAQVFQGEALAKIKTMLGLTADVDTVEGAPPPSLEQQGEQRFGPVAKELWEALNRIQPGAFPPSFAFARQALDKARQLAPLTDDGKSDPATVAKPAAPGQAGHDIEERPPRTFNGYYQLHYGVSPELHAATMVKAQGKDAGTPPEKAAELLGIPAEHLQEWLKMATQQIVAKPEDLSIGPHNRALVRASFTVEVAKKNAQAIWEILHSDGKLQLIEAELYGPYNDEEQRLIRVAFRQLSGGFDLTFYIRQAMEARARTVRAAQAEGGVDGAMMLTTADEQTFSVGGEGTEAGDTSWYKGIHTRGDDAELERALAIAQHGEIDVRTRIRNAIQRDDTDQILRVIDDLEPAERKQVVADGELMAQLNSKLSQQNYERVFKVLTGQADLADRMLSRTIGNTWWKRHVSGKPDQEGMKEDVKTYVRKLRLQFDKQVRAEVVEKLHGQEPSDADRKAIEQEISRRVHEACANIAAGPTEKQVMDDVLNEEDKAEVQSIILHDGEAKDFALVGGKSSDEILAEIRGMTAKDRHDKLGDPAYMQMLGQKLTKEKDYREAMNALNGVGGDAEHPPADGLAALDAKSRSKDQSFGADRDGRDTLRALAKLTPEELEKLKNDPAMQVQVMSALDDDKQRALARQLLGGPTLAVDPNLQDGPEKQAAVDAKKLEFLRQQCIYRLRVACQTSNKWSVVLEEAIEVYKAQLDVEQNPNVPPKPTDNIGKPKDLRTQVWQGVRPDVVAFARDHDDHPGAVTTEKITGDKMIETVRQAVLKKKDPSDELVSAKIWTVDEQLGDKPEALKKELRNFSDDKYKEEDVIAAIQGASDEHVASTWTSVIATPVGGGPTMRQTYETFQQAFQVAAPRIAELEKDEVAAQPPPAPQPVASPEVPADANVGANVEPAAPAPPPLHWSTNIHQSYASDPAIADAELKRRQFLEYTIKVSEGFEAMLRPHMGDNRELTKEHQGYEPNLSGTGNKRYDTLKEALLARIPKLSPDVIAKTIGVKPEDAWILKESAREEIGMFELRHEKNLRSRGRNTSERSVASAEKQDLDTSRIRYGREMATALTKGRIDAGEKEKLDHLGDENDRARDAYKTALETTAMWASLIIGTLVTIVATILTGGLALGPVAAMAIGAATAALSATAKAWVNRQILDTEFDSKDASEMVTKEVITSVMTIGTTFFAQKLLSAVSGLTTVAKQANAARQILQTPPPIWRVFLNQASEQVTSSMMNSVVEAGLEATDPMHFIDGYREGEKEARSAAMAKLAAAPKEAMEGAVTSLLSAAVGKVLRPKGGAHVEFNEAAEGKRVVNLTRNIKKVFGDPEQKVAGALVEWAMNQQDPIDWSKAPADIFAGTIRQYNQVGTEMHTTTAATASRGARAKESLALYGHELTQTEVHAYKEMTKNAGPTDVFVSAKDFVQIRSQMAETGLQVWEAQHPNVTLTDPQREAFVKWVREAPDADTLSDRAHTDPTSIDAVKQAAKAKPPQPTPAAVPEEPIVTPHEPEATKPAAHGEEPAKHDEQPTKHEEEPAKHGGQPAKHVAAPGHGPAPGAHTAASVFAGESPALGEVWSFESVSGNLYHGRYAGIENGRIKLETAQGPAYLDPARLVSSRRGLSVKGLHQFSKDDLVALHSVSGNVRVGRILKYDEQGNIWFQLENGDIQQLNKDRIVVERTERVPPQQARQQPHVVDEQTHGKVVPVVHMGEDAQAHVALATKLGVMPKETIKVGNATFKVGDLFEIGDGRVGVLIEVEVNGQKYLRVAYRSNSQGGFRILPARNEGVYGMPGYDKAIGEHAIMLPNEVEEHLSQKLVAKQVRRDIPEAEGEKVFEGAVPHNRNLGDWAKYEQSPDHVKNTVKEEHILGEAKHMLPTASGHKMAAPNEVVISETSHRPNFKQLVRSYTTETSVAGEVTALVYRSHDNTLEYVVYKDKQNHVWFKSVSKVDAAITPQGVRSVAIDADALTTPLWEYKKQIPQGYAGETHPEQPSYASSWKYLSQLPEIRAFYDATGTPMPESEHAQQAKEPTKPQEPKKAQEVAAPHAQAPQHAQGQAVHPAASMHELFNGETPNNEVWTFESVSGNRYTGRIVSTDGRVVIQTPDGKTASLDPARLVSARRGQSHPALHQYGPHDVITLVSVNGNPRTGVILRYDEAGNVLFQPVQGEPQWLRPEMLDMSKTRRAQPGSEPPIAERSTKPMEAVDPDKVSGQPKPEADPNKVPVAERPTKPMQAVDPQVAEHAGPAPKRNVEAEHPAIQHLTELPPEVMIGPHQRDLVEPALQRLSDADYQRFRGIEAAVTDPVARGFLYKALAAGNSVDDVHWLAQQMAGKDSNWLVDNLTLGDPRGVGGGIKQQWAMSCNAAMVLTLRGNTDPVFALRLRQSNTAVGHADENDPHALNTNQAGMEKAMLESQYTGQHPFSPAGHQGVAQPRASYSGAGRFADDLLNQISAATGMTYHPEPNPSGQRVVTILERSLRKNQQVPVVVGQPGNEQAHYVLIQGRKVTNGVIEYSIHDPWDGTTQWVRASDVEAGRLPGGWDRIGTIEVPSSLPPPAPEAGPRPEQPQGPAEPAAHQRPTVRIDAAQPTATPTAPTAQHGAAPIDHAPQIADAALAAVTQKMSGNAAEQVIEHQLEQGQKPGVNEPDPKQAHGNAQPQPEVSAEVQVAVADKIHAQAVLAEVAIIEKVQEGPKGQHHDPKRQAFTDAWKKQHVDLEKFFKQFDLEAEDAQSKIERSMKNPKIAEALAKVPREELIAIILYTSTHFVEWNRTLREADHGSLDEFGGGIALADRGLSKLPTYEGWVYRGTSLPAEVLAKYVPGQTVTEEAFTSTAYEDAGTANYSGNVKFVIKSKTGRDVAGLSRYDNEKEILFRPGTKFKVVDKERDGDTTIITMEEEGAEHAQLPGGKQKHAEEEHAAKPAGPTAAAVGDFHGAARAESQPEQVLPRAKQALKDLAPRIGAKANGDIVELHVAGSDKPRKIRVVTEALDESTGRSRVARYDEAALKKKDEIITIYISDRAADHHIERAIAHELAEINHRLHGGTNGADALAVGSAATKLSSHDVGRLAELEVMSSQLRSARAKGDAAEVARLEKEGSQLLAHLGFDGSGSSREREMKALVGEEGVAAVEDFRPTSHRGAVATAPAAPTPHPSGKGPDHARIDRLEHDLKRLIDVAIHDKERSASQLPGLDQLNGTLVKLRADLKHAESDPALLAMMQEELDRKLPEVASELKRYRQELSDATRRYEAFEKARDADRAKWRDHKRWEAAKAKVTEVLANYKAEILAAIPGATVKFRGSLAAAFKGSHKVDDVTGAAKRWDPTKFDVDAFIELPDRMWQEELVSPGILPRDQGYARLDDVRNWRRRDALFKAQQQIADELRKIPGYQLEKSGDAHFEITLQSASEGRQERLEGNVYPEGSLTKAGAGDLERTLPDARTNDGRPGKRLPDVNDEI